MPDLHHRPMPKEICCRNWVQLIDYIENTPNLPSGLSGKSATEKLLEGLVDNPRFLIQDPRNPDVAYPVQETHLRDEHYWHSNEFSVLLFENAARVIGGFRPLFHAGIIAGYKMFESAQPKHFQFLRVFSPRMLVNLVSNINRTFNTTKSPKAIVNRPGFVRVKLNYKDEFKNQISKHVCDWNAGVYTGMFVYTGAHDTRVKEVQCISDGGEDCVFEVNYAALGAIGRVWVFFHSLVDPEYIRRRELDNLSLSDLLTTQQDIMAQQAEEIRLAHAKLVEAEKRALEHRITGGFAHEMRNALAGAQLELNTTLNYRDQGKPSYEALKEAATGLLLKINAIHDKYNVPREEIASELIPEIRAIAEISNHLSEIHQGVSKDIDRGLSITNQIREYAKLSELKAGNEPVDLVVLLRSYADRFRQQFEKLGISYSLEGEPSAVVKAHETHVNSIFSNLFLNAKDALEGSDTTEGKEIKVNICKYMESGRRYLKITVADNGPGIPKEYFNEIFEPFFSTKPSSGIGLGLGIVGRLVQLYNGRVEVASMMNEGTTFTILIPEEANGQTDRSHY